MPDEPVIRKIPCVPPHELKVELETRFTESLEAETRDILRDFMVQLDFANDMFRELYKYACVLKYQVRRIAWQFFQIEAGDLESSDDPDGNPVVRSVLTTTGLEDSDWQFNWMQAGGVSTYKVVTGPGDGVPTHHVIIDRDDSNLQMLRWAAAGGEYVGTESPACRPYGMTGLRLQFGTYRPNGALLEFWPSSVAIGSFIYLEQELPMRVIP